MKPKLWVLYDGAGEFAHSFRTKTKGTDALADYPNGAFLKPYYFLTANQVAILRYHEATTVDSIFIRNHNEKVRR